MKRKAWMRSLSASAPRVAVRTQLPWPTKVLGFAAAAVLLAAVVYGAISMTRGPVVDDRAALVADVERARSELRQALLDRDRNAAAAAQWENQHKVDLGTHKQLGEQLAALESENARLREDLSFFESLLPMPVSNSNVVIRSFRLQQEPEGNSMRYRLLVQQRGKPDRDFTGTVALKISLKQGGRPWVIELPDAKAPESGPNPLSFRHYQRVEGTFSLPTGAVVNSVQVTIDSNGQVQAQQTFTM